MWAIHRASVPPDLRADGEREPDSPMPRVNSLASVTSGWKALGVTGGVAGITMAMTSTGSPTLVIAHRQLLR